MDGECSTHEREYIKFMIGQTEGNSLPGKPRCRMETNIKEKGAGVLWAKLTYKGDKWGLFFEQLHSMG